jgi:hypothetical protein
MILNMKTGQLKKERDCNIIHVNPAIDSARKHPFIEKKVEQANKTLRQVGLPIDLNTPAH